MILIMFDIFEALGPTESHFGGIRAIFKIFNFSSFLCPCSLIVFVEFLEICARYKLSIKTGR